MKTNLSILSIALVVLFSMGGCTDINPADNGDNNNPKDTTTQNNPDTPNPPDPAVVDVSEQLTGNTSKGRLSGVFSVANKYWVYTGADTGYGGWDEKTTEGKVRFSQGNLQYQASTNTWRFAPDQFTCISEDANNNASATYSGWIDQFHFGTSGWDNTAKDPTAIYYQPWCRPNIYDGTVFPRYVYTETYNCVDNAFEHKCDTIYYTFEWLGFGPIPPIEQSEWGTYVMNDNHDHGYYIDIKTLAQGKYRNYDWGWYNKISNGGNKEHLWRVLTYQEWHHIIFNRPNAEYLRSVCNINDNGNWYYGIIIMPDDFEPTDDIKWTWSTYSKNSGFSLAEYTKEEWIKLESKGGVFLPLQFEYEAAIIGGDNSTYLSSTHFFDGGASYQSGYKDYDYQMINHLGLVRLVQDVTSSDAEEGGENPNIPDDPGTPSADCYNIQASYLPTGASGLGEMKEQLVSGAKSWFYDSKYGARVSKSNTEAWLYTPTYNMSGMASVKVSFEHAINYAGDMQTQQTMWVTNNFTGDVTTTNWQQVSIPNYPSGDNWTFVSNTVNIPIQYVGEKTVVAFKYTSGGNGSTATWEIKNLTVNAICANN